MAEVVPFRAVRYDLSRAGVADSLIAPPYDVIAESDRSELEAKSPFNIVRVDLPQGDREGKYRNAASELRRWLEDRILRRDDAPALYRYHQVFSVGGREHTRKGFICRIRLRRFDERVVLPHERTLSGPRLDRLELARACHMHLSQVFGLYSDPARIVDRVRGQLRSRFAVDELAAMSSPELRTKLASRERSFLLASRGRIFLLSLRPGAEAAVAGPEPLRTLDVPILHALVLEQTLGID